MRILIVKDAATRIPREVADREEALAIQASGFTVLEVGPDDVARPLAGDEPEQAPADQPAAEQAPAPEATQEPAAEPAPTVRAPRPPAKKAAKR